MNYWNPLAGHQGTTPRPAHTAPGALTVQNLASAPRASVEKDGSGRGRGEIPRVRIPLSPPPVTPRSERDSDLSQGSNPSQGTPKVQNPANVASDRVQKGPSVRSANPRENEGAFAEPRTRVRIPLGSPSKSPVNSRGTAHVGNALPLPGCKPGANAGGRDPWPLGRCYECGEEYPAHLFGCTSPAAVVPGAAPVATPAAPVAGSTIVVPGCGKTLADEVGTCCNRLAWCHCGKCIKHHPSGPCPCHEPGGCRAPRSPVHALPVAGYADAATPEPVVDAPTARVLTPSDAQVRSEQILGIVATVSRLTAGTNGFRDRWRARLENADRSRIAYSYGTCDEVFAFVKMALEGGSF